MGVNDDERVRASDDDDSDYPKQRSRRRDEDEDFEDRRPRRRRKDGDATGGLIPYKNAKALISYYCGVFGLISCFLVLGCFGIVPIILGVMGLKYAKEHPEAKGQAHAIVGIVLGSLEVLTFLAQLTFVIASIANAKK